MAMIDDIMQQLQSMGLDIGGGFGNIGTINPGQISQALQGQYGLSAGQLPSSMFQPLSSDLIKKRGFEQNLESFLKSKDVVIIYFCLICAIFYYFACEFFS